MCNCNKLIKISDTLYLNVQYIKSIYYQTNLTSHKVVVRLQDNTYYEVDEFNNKELAIQRIAQLQTIFNERQT